MINLNGTTPSAPASAVNVSWQSDTSGNVSASLSTINTIGSSPKKLSVSSTAGVLNLDASLADSFIVNLHENITALSIINPIADGQELTMLFKQDATGTWTVGFNANILGSTAPSTTANKFSSQQFTYNIADTSWKALSSGVQGMS